jgi:signal recognition particle GTPase
VEREQLRKKYTKKLSLTVELAYQKDPRVAYFRDLDKKEKQEHKNRKKQEKQRLIEEREVEQRRKQEAIEAEQRQKQEALEIERQEKQKLKKLVQAGRKRLRDLAQSKQYFTDNEAKRHQVMEGVERVCMNADLDELTMITDNLADVTELANALDLLSIQVVLGCSFLTK